MALQADGGVRRRRRRPPCGATRLTLASDAATPIQLRIRWETEAEDGEGNLGRTEAAKS